MVWLNLEAIRTSLLVTALGMGGILASALALAGVIWGLRRVFPPAHDQGSDNKV